MRTAVSLSTSLVRLPSPLGESMLSLHTELVAAGRESTVCARGAGIPPVVTARVEIDTREASVGTMIAQVSARTPSICRWVVSALLVTSNSEIVMSEVLL